MSDGPSNRDVPTGSVIPPGARASEDDARGTGGGNVARLHPPGMPHQVTLDRAVQGVIGAQLRRMYEHFVDQPIPDRLLELVGRLPEPRTEPHLATAPVGIPAAGPAPGLPDEGKPR